MRLGATRTSEMIRIGFCGSGDVALETERGEQRGSILR
jgi:hypothetical protein